MAQREEFEDTKGVISDLVILITPLVSSNSIRWAIVLSVLR
jgi:hypothetical protein